MVRLAVMTHNVLTALKRLALPEKWLTARPKRLRFQISARPGNWCLMRAGCCCGCGA